MGDVKVSVKVDEIQRLLRDHGLEEHGRVQTYIDNQVIQYCDPYVPMLTGALKNSANTATDLGSGEVIYKTPYAARQYYSNFSNQSGLRGSKWFERMKADRLDDILDGAKNLLK